MSGHPILKTKLSIGYRELGKERSVYNPRNGSIWHRRLGLAHQLKSKFALAYGFVYIPANGGRRLRHVTRQCSLVYFKLQLWAPNAQVRHGECSLRCVTHASIYLLPSSPRCLFMSLHNVWGEQGFLVRNPKLIRVECQRLKDWFLWKVGEILNSFLAGCVNSFPICWEYWNAVGNPKGGWREFK